MQRANFSSLKRDSDSKYEPYYQFKNLLPKGCTMEWIVVQQILIDGFISFPIDMAKRVLRENEELHIQRLRGYQINEIVGETRYHGGQAAAEYLIITAVGKKPKKDKK